jgi:DNA-binding Lrp family transcriptional regulator
MDRIDESLLAHLGSVTRPSVLELARRLSVARGTAQARLERLRESGAVAGYQPSLDRRALGYGVLAFVSIQVAQGREAPVLDRLRSMPEVLEAHKTTGDADLLVRVVARSNEHLNDLLESLLATGGIQRTTTALALTSPVERSLADAIEAGLLTDA